MFYENSFVVPAYTLRGIDHTYLKKLLKMSIYKKPHIPILLTVYNKVSMKNVTKR